MSTRSGSRSSSGSNARRGIRGTNAVKTPHDRPRPPGQWEASMSATGLRSSAACHGGGSSQDPTPSYDRIEVRARCAMDVVTPRGGARFDSPLRPRLGTSRHRGRGTPARVQHPPAFHRPVHPCRTRQVRRPQRPSAASPRRRTLPRVIQSGPLNLCVPRAKAIHGAGQMLVVREPLRPTQISQSMPRAGWRTACPIWNDCVGLLVLTPQMPNDGSALAFRCEHRRCAHLIPPPRVPDPR